MAVAVSSGECFARIGSVELCYETFGPDDGIPLLLVMGLGSQMIFWEEDFCALLVDRGFRVIRYDNRDVGRSTIFRDNRPPTLRQLLLRDRRGTAYALDELADDGAGLLDVLGISRAHVVGVSMGGMIAQLIAIRHPARVLSLVSIMSTTGSRRVGNPTPAMLLRLLKRARSDREGFIADTVETLQAIGSKRYPADPAVLRELAARAYERGYHPAGTARQLAAINTAPNRTRQLHGLRLPATVIHGTDDPLIRPSGGRATARAIPGANLVMLPGMAHDLPRPLWSEIVDAIARTAALAG
jgi:pimeloyl-ACP methyl ester carboxylesterase